MDPLEGDKRDAYREAKMPGLGRGSISWLQTDNMNLRRPHVTSSNQSLGTNICITGLILLILLI